MAQISKEKLSTQSDAIIGAISALDESHQAIEAAWPALDVLSSATSFEAIESAPGGIVIETDGTFEAAATIYITLNYGSRKDPVSMSDAYPSIVRGTVDDHSNVTVSEIVVDTESFYGPDDT